VRLGVILSADGARGQEQQQDQRNPGNPMEHGAQRTLRQGHLQEGDASLYPKTAGPESRWRGFAPRETA